MTWRRKGTSTHHRKLAHASVDGSVCHSWEALDGVILPVWRRLCIRPKAHCTIFSPLPLMRKAQVYASLEVGACRYWNDPPRLNRSRSQPRDIDAVWVGRVVTVRWRGTMLSSNHDARRSRDPIAAPTFGSRQCSASPAPSVELYSAHTTSRDGRIAKILK